MQPTTTVDVTESYTLPVVATPIVVMQPSQEGGGLVVGNRSGIDVRGVLHTPESRMLTS